MNHAGFDDVEKNSLGNDCHHQKGENVNVWIQDFDDAKEESNKVASKDKHCFKINIRLLQQTKSYFKINSRSNLASKQSVSKTSKAV